MSRKFQIRDRFTDRRVQTVDTEKELIEFFTNTTGRVPRDYFAWEVDGFPGKVFNVIESDQLTELVADGE